MKSDTYRRLVLISAAVVGLESACTTANPCQSPTADLAGRVSPDATQPPTDAPDLATPRVDVKLTDLSTTCSSWGTSGSSLSFNGTTFFNNCGYGFHLDCSAFSRNPINTAELADKPIRFELQQQYELVSGMNAPPLGAPTAIRILRGEFRVYDQDPQLAQATLLGSWAFTGEQTTAAKTSFHLPPTNKKSLYVSFYTRLDCSQYPPPQSQTWTWTISSLRIFPAAEQ